MAITKTKASDVRLRYDLGVNGGEAIKNIQRLGSEYYGGWCHLVDVVIEYGIIRDITLDLHGNILENWGEDTLTLLEELNKYIEGYLYLESVCGCVYATIIFKEGGPYIQHGRIKYGTDYSLDEFRSLKRESKAFLKDLY